jgi:hypothetical protein
VRPTQDFFSSQSPSLQPQVVYLPYQVGKKEN